MTTITLYVFHNGEFKLSEKARDRIGRYSAEHGGCWINDYYCGRPGCPMERHEKSVEVRYLTPTEARS